MVTRMPQVYGDNMGPVKPRAESSQHLVGISAGAAVSHVMET
jgi:hypothetical protein